MRCLRDHLMKSSCLVWYVACSDCQDQSVSVRRDGNGSGVRAMRMDGAWVKCVQRVE